MAIIYGAVFAFALLGLSLQLLKWLFEILRDLYLGPEEVERRRIVEWNAYQSKQSERDAVAAHELARKTALAHAAGFEGEDCIERDEISLRPRNHYIRYKKRAVEDRPTRLYYLKVKLPTGYGYKIGITSRESVLDRFSRGDHHKIVAIRVLTLHKNRELAAKKEAKILEKFREHRYDGPPVFLYSKGNNEIFTCDVLNLFDGD